MPYKIQKPNKCQVCEKPILRDRKHCQKHVPRTAIWKKRIGMAISRATKGKPKKKGELANGWKGGTTITSGGHRYIFKRDHPYRNSNNYVMEHRLVMEAHIGRYLLPDEIVHHLNENKLDNRIENLQLLTSTAHATHHINKRWAEGILKRKQSTEHINKRLKSIRLNYKPKPKAECRPSLR